MATIQKFQFTVQQIENLMVFAERLSSRTYYKGQTNEFYKSVKHYMENIVVAIANNDPLAIRENKIIMHDLLNEIAQCGPGIFSHIRNASNLLHNQHNIETWLAKLRELIIKQLAGAYSTSHQIYEYDRPHVFNMFFNYACGKSWNPYGFQSQPDMVEIHSNLARLEENDYTVFEKDFFEAYNPLSIITCITSNMHSAFADKIRKGNQDPAGIHFETLEDFMEFFGSLPLVKKAGIFDVLFTLVDAEEKPTEGTNLTFTFAAYRYQLKPVSELKLSLTRFYLTPDGDRLFQGFFQPIDETTSFGIVTGTPELCYFYSANKDSIVQLNHITPNIDLAIFRNQRIPLTQICFAYYVDHGEQDFNHCILEDVNLAATLADIEIYNFQHAILKNVTATPSQFVYLTINRCAAAVSTLTIDATRSMSFKDLFAQPDYFLTLRSQYTSATSLLFFALYTLDDGGLVELLMRYGVHLSNTHNNLLPMQIALKYQRWDSIVAMARNTLAERNDEDRYGFGSALLATLERNDIPTSRLLIAANAQTKNLTTSPFKNTTMHLVAQHNTLELMEYLTEDADLAAVNFEKKTAVQVAALKKHWIFITNLATLISDDDNKYGYSSALILAIHDNQLQTATTLLAAKAKPDRIITTTRQTCLHLAVEKNQPDLCMLVIEAGVLNTPTRDNKMALQIALEKKYWDCVRAFAIAVKPADNVNDVWQLGTALVAAAKENITDLVQLLLSVNVNLNNATAGDLNTALHWCVHHNNTFLLSLLLNAGADFEKVNSDNLTPLQLAESLNHAECVSLIKNFNIAKLLVTALANEDFALAETIILLHPNNPAITSAPAANNNSCLHIAVNFNKPDLITLLIAAGADPAAVNLENLTPIQLAAQKKYYAVILAFVEATEDPLGTYRYGYAMVMAYEDQQYELADKLLAKKADVNTQLGEDRNTCLHLSATRARDADITKFILFGGDCSLRNSKNETPIRCVPVNAWSTVLAFTHVDPATNVNDKFEFGWAVLAAVTANQTPVALAFLPLNCNLNCWFSRNGFSLHIAIRNNNHPLIKALVFAGAKTTLPDGRGQTPVQLANYFDGLALRQNSFSLFCSRRRVELINIQRIIADAAQPNQNPRPALANR